MSSQSRRAMLLAIVCLSLRSAMAAPPPGYVLRWSDEFEGKQLDGTKWWLKTDTNRSATNALEAVSVGQGNLTITTYSVEEGGSLRHRTGIVTSYGLFQQQYGYFEARIKFHDSPGGWSAFWVQSPSYGKPEDNARVAGAEIDIVEHRALDKAGNNLAPKAQLTVHWNGYGAAHQSADTLTPDLGLQDEFHTYGLLWDSTGYKFYIDDQLRWTEDCPASISQRPEYLILSSEVEDKGWAGNIPAGGYGDLAHSTTKMIVDYVRVYALTPSKPPTPAPRDSSQAIFGGREARR